MSVQSIIQASNEMQNQLITRAGEDPEFRARLVEDPSNAIRQEFGIDVPDHAKIQVHESDMSVLHIALPISPNVELDEERLEAIAAGLCCCG
ncbi:MAG: NHLP leader peptide family RiPP precursor [Gemmatimonadetes bacterium]|nr:NHLP leader peptide family RiPP precursor [Gemmatimonadota bacterium]MCY3678153.1 NHLP leader peptide family RiPP precursor [Gemmatimonadota bacterium]MYA44202.1 NHLP leader peptide family natural product precursor [Gemmatimonadota bacterium]MYE91736.1 NHLP leader peptide family natural product precursor [Gemmatimonadota bacterium]